MTEILPTLVSGDFQVTPLVIVLCCNFAVDASSQGCVYQPWGVRAFKPMTKHFPLWELTRTDKGLPNEPDAYSKHMLYHTARILERVRNRCGFPLPINSGFRTPAVNKAVDGKKYSYHLQGRAVDISTRLMSSSQVDTLISVLWDEFPAELIEHKTYIHVAF